MPIAIRAVQRFRGLLCQDSLDCIQATSGFTRLCKFAFILLLDIILFLSQLPQSLVQALLLLKLSGRLPLLLVLHLLQLPQQAVYLRLPRVGLFLSLLKVTLQVALFLDGLLLLCFVRFLLPPLLFFLECLQLSEMSLELLRARSSPSGLSPC